MANERRSEAAEPPFWSSAWDTANQGAAWADEMLGGMPSAAASLVNPVVAPFVNPFLPEDSQLATTHGGIKEKQQEAFAKLPTDAKAFTQYPGAPGNVADRALDAAMFIAVPGVQRLQNALRRHPDDWGGTNRLKEMLFVKKEYPHIAKADDPRAIEAWRTYGWGDPDKFGYNAPTQDPERWVSAIPSSDVSYTGPVDQGAVRGKMTDLFHLTEDMQTAYPWAKDSVVTVNPQAMTQEDRVGKNWFRPKTGETSIASDSPEGARELFGHEGLGHALGQSENHIPRSQRAVQPPVANVPAVQELRRQIDEVMAPIRDLLRAGKTDEANELARQADLPRLNAALQMAETNAGYFQNYDEVWARQVQKAVEENRDFDWWQEYGAPGWDVSGDFFSSPHYDKDFSPRIGDLPFKMMKPDE